MVSKRGTSLSSQNLKSNSEKQNKTYRQLLESIMSFMVEKLQVLWKHKARGYHLKDSGERHLQEGESPVVIESLQICSCNDVDDIFFYKKWDFKKRSYKNSWAFK